MFSKKNDKKTAPKGKSKVPDYGKDPFFVQKADAAKKVMEHYGLPKQFQTGKK